VFARYDGREPSLKELDVAFFFVRYHAYVTGPTESLTVECPVGGGETVTRELDVHDLVFGIDPANTRRGDLWLATEEGLVWPPVPFDVKPGDVVFVDCSAVDLAAQSGLGVVIARDGTFSPLRADAAGEYVQHVVSGAQPVELTGDVVVADTTSGDVVGVLPATVQGRVIRVGNLTGSGSFQVNPVDDETVGGAGTLVLGPADRATLVAVDSGWEVW